MKKSRRTEEQVIRIPKEVAAAAKVAETCRKHGADSPYFNARLN